MGVDLVVLARGCVKNHHSTVCGQSWTPRPSPEPNLESDWWYQTRNWCLHRARRMTCVIRGLVVACTWAIRGKKRWCLRGLGASYAFQPPPEHNLESDWWYPARNWWRHRVRRRPCAIRRPFVAVRGCGSWSSPVVFARPGAFRRHHSHRRTKFGD